ncbi:MAG: DegT/DnrJ/EryC1/StrS family aminotransferase [Deltaproteobacteria bacterium]|nr:DegT/DnrJ/EryC1/StrS family aminotransferase [Deltaproteobacteria bacterium]
MIAFLDLAADFSEVEADARRRIDTVLAKQQFVLGAQTAELETRVREMSGAPAALACSSGSDALYLALVALGIGPGDAVAVPGFTFFASAGAVARAGAQPVFCDIDPASFVAGGEQFEAAIGREFEGCAGQLRHRRSGARLRALMPVHLYGRAAPMAQLAQVAGARRLAIIEDAAQAIGATIDGRWVGRFGSVGCFSFYPTKNLGGAGDGGMLLTDDAATAARLQRLRVHGASASDPYLHREVGINARMGELQAAVLNAKLGHLAVWTERRRWVAARYLERLAPPARAGALILPQVAAESQQVWHQFAVRVAERRDEVAARMEADGVAVRVFYPRPLHLQPCFAELGYQTGDLPGCERAAQQVLCLPIYPSLRADDVDRVCESLIAALAG